MNGYLINVAISFAPYLASSILIWLVLCFAVKVVSVMEADGEDDRWTKKSIIRLKQIRAIIVTALLIIGLFFSLVFPTNTPKNTIGNVASENRAIENYIMNRTAGDISDISRQPKMDDEERQGHFDSLVDYKGNSQ